MAATEAEMLKNAVMAQAMCGTVVSTEQVQDTKGNVFIRLESSDGQRYVMAVPE